MKIAILVGTRPEIIKMSPLLHECQRRGIDFFLIHSNQHYSEKMDAVFFTELELPLPKYNLHVGSSAHANQTGNILIKIEPILERERPNILLVQGDTNTVMAGAVAASKLDIKIAHIEAGLRSYDRRMPEEGNRVVTDHLSEFLFAVTDVQVGILKKEGIAPSQIYEVGNTIVDAVLRNLPLAEKKSPILETLSLEPKGYFLVTAHRAQNVDTIESLERVLTLLGQIEGRVIWPVHYRTARNIRDFKLEVPTNLQLIEPLGYLDFLKLLSNAKKVVTDSGGIQEEACILQIPCITIRDNTERPETVAVGANVLVGTDGARLLEELAKPSAAKWTNPFGDGRTATKILDVLSEHFAVLTPTPEKKSYRVNVIGMGYMGIPTAALLAKAGHAVTGVDISAPKIEQLKRGECPIEEVGLAPLVRAVVDSGQLRFALQPEAADVFILAVPTPEKDRKCDLTFVISAVESLIPVLRDGNLIIVESTVKPFTCRRVIRSLLQKYERNVSVVHCPERAIPGNTLSELTHNTRIIGADEPAAALTAKELYESFVKGPIHVTDTVTAECVKLMENTYRDVNIALSNELAILLQELDANIFEAVQLANKHPRVHLLEPGIGVGGHCIAIDPWFLTEETSSAHLIKLAREINCATPLRIAKKLMEKMGDRKKVGILGVAYKKNVDDARETPVATIVEALENNGFSVRCHDPLVIHWDRPLYAIQEVLDWADLSFVLVDHKAYQELKSDKIIPYEILVSDPRL